MTSAEPAEKIIDAAEMLAKASAMEQKSAADYNQAAATCGENRDSVFKQIFESLIAGEEKHFDEFNRQMEHIKRFGQSYLALQSFGQLVGTARVESSSKQ